MKNCFCGNTQPFSKCCRPILNGLNNATSAEQLMRSRYSAYVMADVDYIINTTHISQRSQLDRKDILQWAKQNQWIKLEILHTDTYQVSFRAYYRDRSSRTNIHFEKSTFILENDKWYYLDGTFNE